MEDGQSSTPRESREVTSTVDHIEIDWPRSLGFFGGIGAAVALGLVPIPIALFVAGVPFLKLLNRPTATRPQLFFSHVVDGAAKPVGGDSEGTIRWTQQPGPKARTRVARAAGRRRSTSRSSGGRSR